jgi:hypothetical protein
VPRGPDPTPRCRSRVPRELYAAEEKPCSALRPPRRSNVPGWTRAGVHPDHRVQIAHALYCPRAGRGHPPVQLPHRRARPTPTRRASIRKGCCPCPSSPARRPRRTAVAEATRDATPSTPPVRGATAAYSAAQLVRSAPVQGPVDGNRCLARVPAKVRLSALLRKRGWPIMRRDAEA